MATNYEAIKNMSLEKMAKFLCRYGTGVPCSYCTANNKDSCKANVERCKDWLMEEKNENQDV